MMKKIKLIINIKIKKIIKMFKKTGRNIKVSREDLTSATIEKLMQYDSLLPNQRNGKSNPYSDQIYAQVADGKTVAVPKYIQHDAIIQWNSMKEKSMNDDNS